MIAFYSWISANTFPEEMDSQNWLRFSTPSRLSLVVNQHGTVLCVQKEKMGNRCKCLLFLPLTDLQTTFADICHRYINMLYVDFAYLEIIGGLG